MNVIQNYVFYCLSIFLCIILLKIYFDVLENSTRDVYDGEKLRKFNPFMFF